MSRDGFTSTTRIRPRIIFAVLLFLSPAAITGQGIFDIRVDTPRDFGYTIGDKIRHEMQLSLREPYRLATSTLPKTGRLNRWLEISMIDSEVRHRGQVASYRIIVEYQVFNAPSQLTSVTIPQLEFITTGGANPIPVFMPEWTFIVAPITKPVPGGEPGLRPDHEPRPIPLMDRLVRLLTSTMLLAGILLYLAYRHWVLPRLSRGRYPFASAFKEIRSIQRRDSEPGSYRLALQIFHGAVNKTAGQVIFPGNLQAFMSANAEYAALASEFSTVYARSQDVFFNDAEIAEPERSIRQLVDLCRHCRNLERSVI